MRFTLCKLFLGVTMAALASAGMTLHTRLWAEAIVSFSIVLYTVVAIWRSAAAENPGHSVLPSAAVGGGYLLLVLCNVFSPIRDLLITNRALVSAGQSLQVSAINQALPSWSSTANFTTTLPNGTQATSPAVASSGVTGPATLTGSTAFTLGTVSFDWDDTLGVGVQLPDSRIPAGAFLIIGHCVWSWLLGARRRLLRHVRVSTACTGGRLMTEAHRPSRYAMPANSVGGRFPKHGKGTAAVREPTAPAETARPALPPKRHPPRCTGRDRAARRPRA